ncbi:hypothetical protein E2C01_029289 [Portunus trituberculatus]|uniref:Uncharacterized protein n=1 Tax=Portunus trituberculatus TaxID=210409 RepID=A0A5B7ENW2_PORTR|nr:hypothetical protein [Portunus trituberculatus]
MFFHTELQETESGEGCVKSRKSNTSVRSQAILFPSAADPPSLCLCRRLQDTDRAAGWSQLPRRDIKLFLPLIVRHVRVSVAVCVCVCGGVQRKTSFTLNGQSFTIVNIVASWWRSHPGQVALCGGGERDEEWWAVKDEGRRGGFCKAQHAPFFPFLIRDLPSITPQKYGRQTPKILITNYNVGILMNVKVKRSRRSNNA